MAVRSRRARERRDVGPGDASNRAGLARARLVDERGVTIDRSTIDRWGQRLRPLFQAATHAHRRPVGEKWWVDETYVRRGGTWTYIYRAIDEDGQVVDAHFSERRNARAVHAFFERAIPATRVSPRQGQPEGVITDKATCYPPGLREVLPNVAHRRRSRSLNHGSERDHGHLKQRRYPMRGLKQAAAADALARGHACIQNVCNGFSQLTRMVPRALRLMPIGLAFPPRPGSAHG